MVSSRQRALKPTQEDWTTREKLLLASLAIKCNNSWNSVARQMQNLASETVRPDGFFNQKTCAAQFDKLMNESGVDKRPKRNEPSDGSSNVIYKKMVEKRTKELEENITELRKTWLTIKNDLDSSATPSKSDNSISATPSKPATSAAPSTRSRESSRQSSAANNEPEKPSTRALTRRESSRLDLKKTLTDLCKEAAEIKSISLMGKPSSDTERAEYDKYILQHVDLSKIKERLGGTVDDPYAVMNDLLLMFQNATMFYQPDHHIYRTAVTLRDKLEPQWRDALLGRVRAGRH